MPTPITAAKMAAASRLSPPPPPIGNVGRGVDGLRVQRALQVIRNGRCHGIPLGGGRRGSHAFGLGDGAFRSLTADGVDGGGGVVPKRLSESLRKVSTAPGALFRLSPLSLSETLPFLFFISFFSTFNAKCSPCGAGTDEVNAGEGGGEAAESHKVMEARSLGIQPVNEKTKVSAVAAPRGAASEESGQ